MLGSTGRCPRSLLPPEEQKAGAEPEELRTARARAVER
jgi:hypothetical protein